MKQIKFTIASNRPTILYGTIKKDKTRGLLVLSKGKVYEFNKLLNIESIQPIQSMTGDKVKNYFMSKKGYKLVNGNGCDLVEKYKKLGHEVTFFCADYLIYKEQQFKVFRDEVELFEGGYFECLKFLKNNQFQSYEWIIRHEGWSVKILIN